MEVQKHDPDHETRDTEQAHVQSSYSESKMEGAIHISHKLQKQVMDVQLRGDREEGITNQYPPTL